VREKKNDMSRDGTTKEEDDSRNECEKENKGASSCVSAESGNGGDEVIKSGVLRKLGGKVENWKSRFFTLDKDGVFSYYKKKPSLAYSSSSTTAHTSGTTRSEDKALKRILLKAATECGTKGVQHHAQKGGVVTSLLFKGIASPPTMWVMYITYPPHARTYYFSASSQAELSSWLSYIQSFVPSSKVK